MNRSFAGQKVMLTLVAICVVSALAVISVTAASGSGTATHGPTANAAPSAKKEVKIKMAALYLAKFKGGAYGEAWLASFKVLKQRFGIDVHLVENLPYTTQ